MLKYLLVITVLFGCGKEGKKEDPTNYPTHEQIIQLTELRNKTALWTPKCHNEGLSYMCGEDEEDGDSLLFMGLLCLSGDLNSCNGVRASQGEDGRMWRSPARVDSDTKNSFSRDMFLGYLAYLIKTKDASSAEKYLSYILKNDYMLCNDATDNRCNMGYIQYRAIWGLMKRVWIHLGLEPTFEMNQGDIGDDTLIKLQSEFSPGGFQLHLIAVEIWLRNVLHSNTKKIQEAAEIIRERQDVNPFFEYVANGRTNVSAKLTLEYCPQIEPDRKHQWAWQRDKREEAWLESSGWDCIFMSNLLIGDLQ